MNLYYSRRDTDLHRIETYTIAAETRIYTEMNLYCSRRDTDLHRIETYTIAAETRIYTELKPIL